MTGITFANLLRSLVLILFGLTFGETAVIFKNYFKVTRSTRRILPMHITGVSAGLMMLEFYVAFTTATRGYGHEFSWLILYNIVALALVYASLVAVRFHITRKAKAHKHIREDMPSLLEDPDFTP